MITKYDAKFQKQGLSFVELKGEMMVVAQQFGKLLGYGNNGQSLVTTVRDPANEFIEGRDYHIVKGSDLRGIKRALKAGIVGNKAKAICVLTESGVDLVCTKTGKPIGKELRRFLVEGVYPQIRRGKEPAVIELKEKPVKVENASSMEKLKALATLAGIHTRLGRTILALMAAKCMPEEREALLHAAKADATDAVMTQLFSPTHEECLDKNLVEFLEAKESEEPIDQQPQGDGKTKELPTLEAATFSKKAILAQLNAEVLASGKGQPIADADPIFTNMAVAMGLIGDEEFGCWNQVHDQVADKALATNWRFNVKGAELLKKELFAYANDRKGVLDSAKAANLITHVARVGKGTITSLRQQRTLTRSFFPAIRH